MKLIPLNSSVFSPRWKPVNTEDLVQDEEDRHPSIIKNGGLDETALTEAGDVVNVNNDLTTVTWTSDEKEDLKKDEPKEDVEKKEEKNEEKKEEKKEEEKDTEKEGEEKAEEGEGEDAPLKPEENWRSITVKDWTVEFHSLPKSQIILIVIVKNSSYIDWPQYQHFGL